MDDGLRNAIIGAEPRDGLLEYYLATKTRASFQGSGDLKKRVRGTLGVPRASVSDSSLESLDSFFTARNKIAHAMDYEQPDEPGRTKRIHRSVDEVTAMCNNALAVSADLLHAVADVIIAARRVRLRPIAWCTDRVAASLYTWRRSPCDSSRELFTSISKGPRR